MIYKHTSQSSRINKGQSVPLPAHDAAVISERATEIAKSKISKWRSGRFLRPMRARGQVGVVVPGHVRHLLYQDRGIRSFVMHSLADRTIPIRDKSGQIHFRRATQENIGRRRITSRNSRGRIVTSKLTWWHPGLKPKDFLESSLREALNEWIAQMDQHGRLEFLDRVSKERKG